MGVDIIAQDLAALALQARPRNPIALTVIGQSNEHGNVPVTDTSVPQAFRSLRNPDGVRVPIGPAVSPTGGWQCKVYDDLWDWGYDARIVNAAAGSMSMMLDAAGYVHYWQASSLFNGARPARTAGDRGYVGDVMSPDGQSYWLCTTGNTRFAFNSGPATLSAVGYGPAYADYAGGLGVVTPGASPALQNLVSAATRPTFPTSPIGNQVTDGGLVWTLIASSVAPPYASAGAVLTETQAGIGFDPLGILQRAHEETQRVRGVTRKLVYIANGQADVGIGTTLYQAALTSVASFFLKRGYEVILGLTNYSPGTVGSIVAWSALQTARTNALAALQAANPGRVWAGADLVALMGTSGPMGGARITGAISGGTLTVSAVAQGAIEIGHNVWSGTNLVGVVTGGAGTAWTLSGAVATASASLIVAGGFLQSDGVHLNAAGAAGPAAGGVSCAGTHVANAIKAVVPLIPR